MHLPFERSYWIEPGRLLAGFFPGDPDPVEAPEMPGQRGFVEQWTNQP
jgi:hypothetical protein